MIAFLYQPSSRFNGTLSLPLITDTPGDGRQQNSSACSDLRSCQPALHATRQLVYGSSMDFSRSSGVLLHPTSLPGPHGIGDLGPEAYRFVDFLHSAGQKLWQVLPLNPTGYAD